MQSLERCAPLPVATGCAAMLADQPDNLWLPELDSYQADDLSSSISDWMVGLSPGAMHEGDKGGHCNTADTPAPPKVTSYDTQLELMLLDSFCSDGLESPLPGASGGSNSSSTHSGYQAFSASPTTQVYPYHHPQQQQQQQHAAPFPAATYSFLPASSTFDGRYQQQQQSHASVGCWVASQAQVPTGTLLSAGHSFAAGHMQSGYGSCSAAAAAYTNLPPPVFQAAPPTAAYMPEVASVQEASLLAPTAYMQAAGSMGAAAYGGQLGGYMPAMPHAYYSAQQAGAPATSQQAGMGRRSSNSSSQFEEVEVAYPSPATAARSTSGVSAMGAACGSAHGEVSVSAAYGSAGDTTGSLVRTGSARASAAVAANSGNVAGRSTGHNGARKAEPAAPAAAPKVQQGGISKPPRPNAGKPVMTKSAKRKLREAQEQSDMQASSDKIKDLAAKRDSLKTALRQLQDSSDKARAALNKLKSSYETITKENDQLRQEQQELKAMVEALKQRFNLQDLPDVTGPKASSSP